MVHHYDFARIHHLNHKQVSSSDQTNAWMERDDVKAVAAQKVTYGTMSEDDVRGLFAKFKSDFGN